MTDRKFKILSIVPSSSGLENEFNFNIDVARLNSIKAIVHGWAFHRDREIESIELGSSCENNFDKKTIESNINRADVYNVMKHERSFKSGFSGYKEIFNPIDGIEIKIIFPDKEYILISVIFDKITEITNKKNIKNFDIYKYAVKYLISQLKTKQSRLKLRQTIFSLMTFNRSHILFKYHLYISQLKKKIETINHHNEKLIRNTAAYLTNDTKFQQKLKFSTDIIVPVYNGIEFLDSFFESLFINTFSSYNLIVIDDCSPDATIWAYLNEKLSGKKNVTLLRNEKNIGFVETFNKAYQLTKNHFVCLNTDIVLPPFWLERLMAPIVKDSKTASVTPFTNAGTICSFPTIIVDNPLFGGASPEEVDSVFMNFNVEHLEKIELPTCVGFCTAFNKTVADKIGMFDVVFSPGYGEENDWSLRASLKGYKNVMATNLFVYHKHGASFNTAAIDRSDIRNKHLDILTSRYPQYMANVNRFIDEDPLYQHRTIATILASCNLPQRKCVLIIDHNIGGGANIYRNDKIERIIEEGQQGVLLLTYDNINFNFVLSSYYKNYKSYLSFEHIEDIENLINYIEIEEVFYNNAVTFLYSDLKKLLFLFKKLKDIKSAKITVTFHDFYAVCPSYNLLNDQGKFCNIPSTDTCNNCIKMNTNIVYAYPETIDTWRQIWSHILEISDNILFFNESTLSIVKKAYPTLGTKNIHVIPHIVKNIGTPPKVFYDGKISIGVLGAINYNKGSKIVHEIASKIALHKLDIDLIIIGSIENSESMPNFVKVHGPYRPQDLSEIIENYGINVFFSPSICPETFSYVISELMQLNMPVFCFDLGAQGERIKNYRYGYLIDQIDAAYALDIIQKECPKLLDKRYNLDNAV